MKIAIASDHAGFEYKEAIKNKLVECGYDLEDFGTDSTKSCDYPDFIRPAAEAVANGRCQRGIVIGGSGNGEAMVANKVAGVRCALCWDMKSAELSRRHNNANMLSLGQRLVSKESALEMVKLCLETPFDGGRHEKRIKKIDNPSATA